jgi:hypothetical protein
MTTDNCQQVTGIRCSTYEDDDPGGHYYLTIEMHGGFAIQASLCKATGSVRCELWDDRNSLTQGWRRIPDLDVPGSYAGCEGLSMDPYEFLEWREVASGREPREYFGAHYRATRKEEIEAELAKPSETLEQIEAKWEAIRREEAAKSPEQKVAELKKQLDDWYAKDKKTVEEQVLALQADEPTGIAGE